MWSNGGQATLAIAGSNLTGVDIGEDWLEKGHISATSLASYSTARPVWRGEGRKVPRGNSLASYPVRSVSRKATVSVRQSTLSWSSQAPWTYSRQITPS